MVYKNLFDFGTNSLTLKTLVSFDDSIKEGVQVLVSAFSEDLNHNNQNSSAKNFNQAKVGEAIVVRKEFIDFLQFNIDYALNLKAVFKPFGAANIEDISKSFLIDKTLNTVLKKRAVSLDTSFLRLSYILEAVKGFLEENAVHDLLLQTKNIITVGGGYSWEVKFSESEQLNKTFQLQNEASILVFNENIESREWEEVILTGDNIALLKIISDIVKTSASFENILEIVEKYQLALIALDDKGELKIFQGTGS